MINNLKRKWIRRYLTTSDPDSLVSGSAGKAVSAFHRAVKKSEAYRRIMEVQSIRPGEIKSPDDFSKRVPVTDKNNFFSVFPLNEIMAKQDFPKIRNIMTSSGFSGKFAFGADLLGRESSSRFFVDTALDLLFNTSLKKTFLINCTPMGVHVETSLPLAETSVRSDMVIAILKKVSVHYDQTIIIGDPYFMKKLVEEGCEAGIRWKNLGVSLVMGQDWFPETLRSYLANLMELDPEKTTDRMMLATMGLTELGLNVFHETPETVRIRRMAQRDGHLREKLFGTEKAACGTLFHYYPMRFFLEEHTDGSLLFTTLSKSTVIPLIRYYSGDCGKLISYNELVRLLAQFRLADLKPWLKLPLATMTGRATNVLPYKGQPLYPEDLKLGLYETENAARQTTGYFVLSVEQEKPLVEVQLKPGMTPSAELGKVYSRAFQQYVKPELAIKLYSYHDFPYGMELNYEKKFLNLK